MISLWEKCLSPMGSNPSFTGSRKTGLINRKLQPRNKSILDEKPV